MQAITQKTELELITAQEIEWTNYQQAQLEDVQPLAVVRQHVEHAVGGIDGEFGAARTPGSSSSLQQPHSRGRAHWRPSFGKKKDEHSSSFSFNAISDYWPKILA